MNKNAVKKYAVWARTELITRVSQRAMMYGITPKNCGNPDADAIQDRILSPIEKRQRKALIQRIQTIGYDQTIEAAAYTWFNRFAALRFMEVNNYLPSHIRIFTNDAGEFKPQILAEAIHLDMDGLDKQKIYALEEANQTEELFKYLLVTQCCALNSLLPGMFQKIEDYTELLLPDHLLRQGSVIEQLVTSIPEEDWTDQVQIIGWLYQYYISEKHEEVIDPLHGKFISPEDIPAATQLFTPDWVVKYIVDNALGHYWIEHTPNSSLASQLLYAVPVTPSNDDASQTIDNHSLQTIKPQDVTVFDPCVGSGHFLVYAVDVLMKIYREYGYSDRDAIAQIIQNNIFGLDIDERAVQLAYFALMMKGCQYDRRFLKKGLSPHIYQIADTSSIDLGILNNISNPIDKSNLESLLDAMKNARETGSMTSIPSIQTDLLFDNLSKIIAQNPLFNDNAQNIKNWMNVINLMTKKYAVVMTNPPYLNKYSDELKSYIQNYYKDYSGDLFSIFIYRCIQFCMPGGYAGLMTPNVWMFIKSYEKLRQYILSNHAVTTLVQMAKGAFFAEATVDICAFVIQNQSQKKIGTFVRLEQFTGNMDLQNEKYLEALNDPACQFRYLASSELFKSLPGMQIGYWACDALIHAFQHGTPLRQFAPPRQGLATTNNNKYLRHWFEVDRQLIGFGLDQHAAVHSQFKWFPYNKGGEFRKWYGNQDYIVYYKNNGENIKHDVLTKYPYLKTPDFVVKNPETYFKPALSWSKISSGNAAFRYFPQGFLYDVSGCSIFFDSDADLYLFAGFLNSAVCSAMLEIISPTLNYETGHIAALPILNFDRYREHIQTLVKNNIRLSQQDWNTQEISWEFNRHPLICGTKTISEAYALWERECGDRFSALKNNEQELNRIFIDIYGLQDKLTPEVDDKDVTVRKADLQRDVRSFISYAVGCMFGRYSPDISDQWAGISDQLAAGRDHDTLTTNHYHPDADNIIPICDDDYFDDDIVARFVLFVQHVYGKDTLEENLQFIADALAGKGSAREVIRSYFISGFYPDHVKMYQNRPIYWLFDSGKKNGFKCLIDMHRYQPDTLARIRTDYIHEQQARYRTIMADLEQRINSTSPSARVKLNKKLSIIQAQNEELHRYEEKMHHLADQMIAIDLDDGVKVNYAKFGDVLAKIKSLNG